MNSRANEKLGMLLVVASAMCYGFIAYFGLNIIRQNFSPFNTMFWRFLFASIFLFIILLFNHKKFRASKKQIVSLLFSSSIFHGTATSLYFVAATYVGGGLASVLLFTHPITVLFFNRIFYKNPIAKICYVSLPLMLIGISLLSDFGLYKIDFSGVMIGLLAAVFFGLYIVSSKKNSLDPMLSAFVICVGCVIMCFTISVLQGSFVVPQSADIWLNILGLSLICTTFPILLFLNGLKHIASEKAAIISMLEPPLVMLVGYLLLDEKIATMQLCGALMILCAALLVIIKSPSKKENFVQEHML